jgi:ligand-binding sensor domain-containing protein
MDRTEVFRKIILGALLLAAVLFSQTAQAGQRWVTFSSFNDVRRMRMIHDSLYVATSGGLLVITDSVNPGKTYTNTDGLGTVDLTDIMVAADGQIWITGDGRLIKFGSGQEPYLFLDNSNNPFRLLCVADDGDYLWVGTELGLILFSKKQFGGEIQDSYTLFGSLNQSPAVQGIFLSGDSIWIATSAGLAVTDRRDRVRMKSPASWTTFNQTSNPELGSSNFAGVVGFESSIWVATANGSFRLDRSLSDTIFAPVALTHGYKVTDLQVQNDSLFLYSAGGLVAGQGTVFASLPTTGLSSQPQTGYNTGQFRWVGVQSGGIYQNSSGSFVAYTHTGLPSEDITGVTVDKSGTVTAMLHRTGVAQLIDSVWVMRSFSVGDHSTFIISDSSNYQWVGTFGNGLWRVGTDSLARFGHTNSTLRGNNDVNGSSYVVINGLATDGSVLYAACYRALNGYPIAFCDLSRLDTPSAWDSIGLADGITSTAVSTIDYQNSNLVVGTLSGGLYWCTFGADPHDRASRTCSYKNKDNSFLRSDGVRVVKFAPDGSLWVGTNFGLSHYDAGIDQFVNVDLPAGIGPDITDIEFDQRGNLYASTHNGLARFDATVGAFDVMTSLNSGLVADDINSLMLDHRTGNLWAATSSGLSLWTSPIANPTQNLDSVFAFPNPFVVRSAGDRLNFTYAKAGTVTIFNVAGDRITELSVNSSWDGRNQQGKPVASGVYLFVLRATDGGVARGKFLLVNQR